MVRVAQALREALWLAHDSGSAWCSGYHICLTRRRSPVQSRALISVPPMHRSKHTGNSVLPLGLEPRTFRLLAECSNQLSYESTLPPQPETAPRIWDMAPCMPPVGNIAPAVCRCNVVPAIFSKVCKLPPPHYRTRAQGCNVCALQILRSSQLGAEHLLRRSSSGNARPRFR